MYLFGKRIDQLEPNDILRLINSQIPESKTLDYKRELNIQQDKDKKEFLYDISALFNTDGGCLVYGIEELKDEVGQSTGRPDGLTGISLENVDKLFQKIEDFVRANTDPPISNIGLKALDVNGKTILIVGINKGFGLPTMVTFNESNKFYRRKNTGKYAVDVYELNDMFMQNQIFKEAAEKFTAERIKKVLSLKIFPTLQLDSPLFIQVIPYSFKQDQTLDLGEAKSSTILQWMRPIGCSGYDQMYNIDGFATFGIDRTDKSMIAYNQIFRNGIFESYKGNAIVRQRTNNGQLRSIIWGINIVNDVVSTISNAFKVLQSLAVEPPYLIFISLHKTQGAYIEAGTPFPGNPILAEEIVLPPISLFNTNTNLMKELKPLFDIVWQSSGYSESPEYPS